ncbi:NAD(P)H-binding protein [Nocardiopsis nanhaiensis]
MTRQDTILVTGATGNVGRHLVPELHTSGARVRVLTRTPETANAPAGVEVFGGDLSAPETLQPALEGVDTVFLLWPWYSADGADEAVKVIARHARRVVYFSSLSVTDDATPEENGVWGQIEALIQASGLEWTFLRVGGLAANAFQWADQIRLDGVVRAPFGRAGRTLIHERDVGEVAARVLAEQGHLGAVYDITGPEVLTQAEQVRVIGEAVGRPVRWEEQPVTEAREETLAAIGDEAFVDVALRYWETLVENPEPVRPGVRQVTGNPGRTFRSWVDDHVDEFRPLTTAQLAYRYKAAFEGEAEIGDALRLMAPEMVRVAPLETGGAPVEVRGTDDILANAERLGADYEFHAVHIEGPFLAENQFALRFTFDETHLPTGVRGTTTKISLLTVRDGSLVREEVHYFDEPQAT